MTDFTRAYYNSELTAILESAKTKCLSRVFYLYIYKSSNTNYYRDWEVSLCVELGHVCLDSDKDCISMQLAMHMHVGGHIHSLHVFTSMHCQVLLYQLYVTRWRNGCLASCIS